MSKSLKEVRLILLSFEGCRLGVLLALLHEGFCGLLLGEMPRLEAAPNVAALLLLRPAGDEHLQDSLDCRGHPQRYFDIAGSLAFGPGCEGFLLLFIELFLMGMEGLEPGVGDESECLVGLGEEVLHEDRGSEVLVGRGLREVQGGGVPLGQIEADVHNLRFFEHLHSNRIFVFFLISTLPPISASRVLPSSSVLDNNNRMKIWTKQQKAPSVQPVTSFSGYYQFLSIDFPAPVYFQGFLYPSVTTAFQAARTNDISLRRKISEAPTAEDFKTMIRDIKSAPDWNERRIQVMLRLNRDKFKRNKDLGLKLFATQDRQLINGYGGGGEAQSFWGMILQQQQFSGLNTLGKILTQLRAEMKDCTDFSQWLQDQNLEEDKALWPEASLVVEKEGNEVDSLVLAGRSRFILGSHPSSDFKLEHGSISKFHAGLYFSSDMELILVDLNSSHGTSIIRHEQEIKLEPLRPESLQHKDIICLGMSSRRYHCFFSYEEADRRIAEKEEAERQELLRIESIKEAEKGRAENEERTREQIKGLLQLKEYQCLYVEGVTRAFPYQTMKQIFNRYGPVKNIRISIDKKTGRYMGSALIYFHQGTTISSVLSNIALLGELPHAFRTKAVFRQEADNIIASFQPHSPPNNEDQPRRLRGSLGWRQSKEEGASRSRSRQRPIRRSPSSSSRSSSSSGISSSPTPAQRVLTKKERRN